MLVFVGEEYLNQKCIYSMTNEFNNLDIMSYFKINKNSVMGGVMERIYNYLCLGSWELNNEYLEFYSQEYDSFEEFLYKRYNLGDELVSEINNALSRGKKIYVVDISHKKDYNIKSLLTDENFLPKFGSFWKEKIDCED